MIYPRRASHWTCALVIYALIFFSCTKKTPANPDLHYEPAAYAQGFTVAECEGYSVVDLFDPWKKGKLLQRYILLKDHHLDRSRLPAGTVINIPVRKAIVYSSVHCAMMDELDATDCIAGVCDYPYIRLGAVRALCEAGKIKDMGVSTSPNIEKIIDLGADVIITSPFENGSYGAVEKTGIPIVECADYMETSPLGRAEWIKFIGLLVCKTGDADSSFRQTERRYLETKSQAENAGDKPTLLVGMKYGAPWYVPAGESFMAQLFRDAGADYIFKELPGTGGTPLSFETVLDKAGSADTWLIQYNNNQDLTYESLASDFSSYSQFDAFKKRRIYGCNTHYSLYYEEMPVHPDYLLAELIAIFHPELIPEHRFRYFKPLEQGKR